MNAGFSCSYETKWRSVSFEGRSPALHGSKSQLEHQVLRDSNITNTSSGSGSENGSGSNETNPLKEELSSLKRKLKLLEETLSSHDSATPEEKFNAINSGNSNSSRITGSNLDSASSIHSNSVNPVVSDADLLDLYGGYTSLQVKGNIRRVNYGPLSWASLMRKDPWLNVLWKYVDNKQLGLTCLITQKVPQISQDAINTLNTDRSESTELKQGNEEIFQKKALENEGIDEMVPFKSLTKFTKNLNDTSTKILENVNVSTVTLGKTLFDGRCNPELQLIEKIKMILPKKKVLWSLIDRFFMKLYLHFPFIDELDFKKELSKIIGPVSYEDVPFDKVKIEKKLDLAIIAICLILLRLTYLSLFSNRNCVNVHRMNSSDDNIEKYLLENSINLVNIEVANSCIECFQYGRKSNLTVFQALLYMRLYRSHAPEEGDGVDGGDSQVATAMLIQMAFSLGLNREPEKFDNCLDPKINNMGRKIWHFLVRSDFIHCYSVGNPTTIHLSHFDTKIPFLAEGNSNLVDLERETAAIRSFSYLGESLGTLRKVLDMVMDLNNGIPINELTQKLNVVERVASEVFNVIESIRKMQSTNDLTLFGYVVKSKIFISVKSSLLTLYYHLYLHYEKLYNNELSYFYLKKMFAIIYEDILPYLFELLYGNLANSGLTLNPSMELALHKSNQVNLSCLARVNYLRTMMELKADHARRLQIDQAYNSHYYRFKSLSTNLRRTGDLITMIFERFGTRYYYAWRVSKAHSSLFKFLGSNELFTKSIPGIKKLHAFQFTAEQLEDLDSVVHAIGKRVEGAVFYEDSVDKAPPFEKGTGISPSISAKSEIVTPYSSIGSPPQESRPNNQYIDQMWLLMMAMKFDPVDLEGNVMSVSDPVSSNDSLFSHMGAYNSNNFGDGSGNVNDDNTDDSIDDAAGQANGNGSLATPTNKTQGGLFNARSRQGSALFKGVFDGSIAPVSFGIDPNRTPYFPNSDSIGASQTYYNTDFDLFSAYNLESIL